MSLAHKYKKSLERRWCVRFRTAHPDGDTYDGVVTAVARRFIILCVESDFEFDGVVVLPKKFLNGYRDGRLEACANTILRKNSQIKRARSPRWLNGCGTLREIIQAIQRKSIWPGVEIIFDEGKESAFYLGPIVQVGGEGFSLKCYDAAGKWEKEYEINFDEVFRVEIESTYCDHFNAYMKSKR